MSDAEMARGKRTADAQTPVSQAEIPQEAAPREHASQDVANPLAGAEEAARIAELESQLAAAREDWLRAKAEAENVRRRAQEDVAKAHRFGIEGFASALLPVKDSLDAALKVDKSTVEAYREGVEITARQLEAALAKFAVTEVDPQGQKFDPHRHQAISQVESASEANTVVTVLQKGFLLHDRVLRPALVIVSKGPAQQAADPGADAAGTGTA